jgi:hypothetical protein
MADFCCDGLPLTPPQLGRTRHPPDPDRRDAFDSDHLWPDLARRCEYGAHASSLHLDCDAFGMNRASGCRNDHAVGNGQEIGWQSFSTEFSTFQTFSIEASSANFSVVGSVNFGA